MVILQSLRRRWLRLGALGAGLALAAAAQAPARIVSTFPSATETLFALGAGNRVVGVSNYCQYPPAVLHLPRVGTYLQPDLEAIARLRPDLVVVAAPAVELRERLTALHIRSVAVPIGSLNDVYAMIQEIGAAVGLAGPAQQLDASIRSRLDADRAQARGRPRPSALMVVGRDPGQLTHLVGVGPSAYLGELLEIAGGRNVLDGTRIAYPQISLETVMRLNPEVILDASMDTDPGGAGATASVRLQQPWKTRRELRAAQNGTVCGLTAQALVTPGPRVVDAVALIQACLLAPGRRP